MPLAPIMLRSARMVGAFDPPPFLAPGLIRQADIQTIISHEVSAFARRHGGSIAAFMFRSDEQAIPPTGGL